MSRNDLEKMLSTKKKLNKNRVAAEKGKVLGLDIQQIVSEPTPENEIFGKIALNIRKGAEPLNRVVAKEDDIRKNNPLTNRGQKVVDVIQFCEDPQYLGVPKLHSMRDYPDFKGPIAQKELLWKFCMEKDPVDGQRMWNELVLETGMRATKTTTVSFIELYEVYKTLMDEFPQLSYGVLPRQEIFFNNVAGSQTQSKDTVFAKLEEFIPNSPWFQKYIAYLRSLKFDSEGNPYFKALDNSYEFRDKNITLRSLNSNSAGQVGKTARLIVFDELGRMKNTDGSLAGSSVYSSLSKATQTFGRNGLKISCSSVWMEGDPMEERTALAGKVPHYLVYSLPTWMFNPTITRESLESEFLKNFEDASRDFGNIRPKAESDAVEMKELVEAVIKPNRKPLINFVQIIDERIDADSVKRKYIKQVADHWPTLEKSTLRVMHCDPGLTDDSYAIGVGHLEVAKKTTGEQKYKVIIDLVIEWKPDPKIGSIVDYNNVEEVIVKLVELYRIFDISFDRWNSEGTVQSLRQKGIVANTLDFTQAEQMAMFINCKQMIYAGEFESYVGDEATCEQFKHLKRIGNKIDHPKTGKITDKDRSDCWMAIAYKLTSKLHITAPNPGQMAKPRIARGGGFSSPQRRL